VVEKYISMQKGYEKAGAIRGEKEKAHKTLYITLYEKLFRTSQK
jgi:hypothetical protein